MWSEERATEASGARRGEAQPRYWSVGTDDAAVAAAARSPSRCAGAAAGRARGEQRVSGRSTAGEFTLRNGEFTLRYGATLTLQSSTNPNDAYKAITLAITLAIALHQE